jgi:hypothetical protein
MAILQAAQFAAAGQVAGGRIVPADGLKDEA